jgi:hypothetical protein
VFEPMLFAFCFLLFAFCFSESSTQPDEKIVYWERNTVSPFGCGLRL